MTFHTPCDIATLSPYVLSGRTFRTAVTFSESCSSAVSSVMPFTLSNHLQHLLLYFNLYQPDEVIPQYLRKAFTSNGTSGQCFTNMSQWSLQNAFPYKGELVHMSGRDRFGSPCTAFCVFKL